MEPSHLYTVVDMMTNGRTRAEALAPRVLLPPPRPAAPLETRPSGPRFAAEAIVLGLLAAGVLGAMGLGVSVLLVR